MRVWLFNPENDLALAAGTANFTPPKSVASFKRALALLPAWWAEPGDNVLAPGANAARRLDELNRRFDLGVRLGAAEGVPSPWGWSANAVAQFRRAGCTGPFPDVEALRMLSHRRTALRLHRALQGRLPYPLPPEPIEATSTDMLPAGCDFYLKAPWSCSGRGVVDCAGMSAESARMRAEGSIRRQGSVMVEPRLEKVRDFAMLFTVRENGRVDYEGLSLFFNSGMSAYGGNVLAPQEELEAELNAPYLAETAREVAEALTGIIGGAYCGPLGVDMMLYGPERLICPTVEVNLRRTMGFTALALSRRFGRGKFTVTYEGARVETAEGTVVELT